MLDFAKAQRPFAGANGQVEIELGWRGGWQVVTFDGGPYDRFPGKQLAFGVCVRAENVPYAKVDVHIPIEDFSVPVVPDDMIRAAMELTYEAALRDNRRVYVGCLGGWGRTGLYLALLAKAAGVPDPVQFIRDTYTPRAVETNEQEAYVAKFDVTKVAKAVNRLGRRRFLRNLVQTALGRR